MVNITERIHDGTIPNISQNEVVRNIFKPTVLFIFPSMFLLFSFFVFSVSSHEYSIRVSVFSHQW